MEISDSLDACGLACPLPLLKAKQALNRLSSGQILAIVCTDPGSVRDFSVFAEQSGHILLKTDEQEHKYFYWIKKA